MAELLKSGRNPRSAVTGPMADVVRDSTQYMTEQDVAAIATYLRVAFSVRLRTVARHSLVDRRDESGRSWRETNGRPAGAFTWTVALPAIVFRAAARASPSTTLAGN